MRVVFALGFAALCIAVPPSLAAAGASDRFVEFHYGDAGGGLSDNSWTKTYDLNTVNVLLPGKFTVVSTSLDNPESIQAELKVLDLLRPYCARPDGAYPTPAKLYAVVKESCSQWQCNAIEASGIELSSSELTVESVGGLLGSWKNISWWS